MTIEQLLIDVKTRVDKKLLFHGTFSSDDLNQVLELLVTRQTILENLRNISSSPLGEDGSSTEEIERLTQIRDRLPESGIFEIAGRLRETYQNLGENSSGVIKASAGSVLALTLYNQSPATRWIQLFDKSVDNLAEGDIPKETYPIFPQVFLILDSNYFGEKGATFNNGIVFGFSSTGNSYTPASASFQLHLKYI